MLGLRWKTVLLICVIHVAVVFLFIWWSLTSPAEMPPLYFIVLLDYPTLLPLSWLCGLLGIDLSEVNLIALGLLLGVLGSFQWMIVARLLWPLTFGYKPDMGPVDERIRARRKKRGLPDLFEHHDDVHQ